MNCSNFSYCIKTRCGSEGRPRWSQKEDHSAILPNLCTTTDYKWTDKSSTGKEERPHPCQIDFWWFECGRQPKTTFLPYSICVYCKWFRNGKLSSGAKSPNFIQNLIRFAVWFPEHGQSRTHYCSLYVYVCAVNYYYQQRILLVISLRPKGLFSRISRL